MNKITQIIIATLVTGTVFGNNFSSITNKYDRNYGNNSPITIEPTVNRVSYVVSPYLQNATQTSMVLMWEIYENSSARVVYSKNGSDDKDTVTVKSSDIFSTNQGTYIYTAYMENLTPNSSYSYEVIVGNSTDSGTDYTFKTAPEKNGPFKFLLWGDNRSNPSKHQLVAEAMVREGGDVAFNVGDLVGTGTNYNEWKTQYFNPAQNLLKQVPTFVSIGNHEYDSKWFYNYLNHPINNSAPKKENFYSFTYGPVFIIVLDNNADWGTNTDLITPGSTQYNWLVSELNSDAANDANWIMVMAHCPPYTNGWDSPGYDGSKVTREHLMPLFEEYGVDLVFNGHTHDYERGHLNGVNYVISGGGGSALDHIVNDFSHITVYKSDYHYIVMDIQKHQIKYSVYNPSGTLLDDTTFIKGKKELLSDVTLTESGVLKQGDETTIKWTTENTSGKAIIKLRSGEEDILVFDTIDIGQESYDWVIPTSVPNSEDYTIVVKQDYLEATSAKFTIHKNGSATTNINQNQGQPLGIHLSGKKQISLSLPRKGMATVKLFTANGREVYSNSQQYNQGMNIITSAIGAFSNQMLLVKVEFEGKTITRSINLQ